MALSPGTRLGPYEIVGALGAGGMGEVYRARDTRLGREVAIKSLTNEFARDEARLARFLREAQTLAALSHPNIAVIHGLEDEGGVPHLVLELIEGETLAARIARGPLALPDALALASQIAAAIEAAHERGVVHRDLKPGNIMVTPAGLVKVLDFGLAKLDAAALPSAESTQMPTMTAHADATVAGAILGTAAYMSPEQARGKPVDRRCDVWAFGCVLFECLSGHAAFEGETTSDLIARILEREPDWSGLPAGTPAPVREVLRRCLRKDLESRPRDIRDVRLELAQAASAPAARLERTGERSIAVIPFENQSSSEDDYFTDGMTDEILNALTHISGLRVAARSSCFAFKGRREDPRTVGEKLDVATVLEGSVRRAGPRLRITVQLVNVADGYQVWSERYDRELTDVFELQDEIANAIAKRLKGDSDSQSTPAAPRVGTRSLEAYDALLRGRALQAKRGRYVQEAMRCFEQALALDPDYVEPRAWLADSYRLLGTFGSAPFHQAMQLSKRYSREALQRDPDAAEVWGTLAALSEQYDWAYAASDRYSELLYALEPDHARGMCQQALWHLHRGAWSADRATAMTARAMEIDPLNAWIGGMHSFCLSIAGRHEEAMALAERAHALDKESFFPHVNVMMTYTLAGRLGDAADLGPEVLRNSGRQPWALGAYGCTLGAAGRHEQAAAVLDEMLARRRHEFCGTGWMAMIAGYLGREAQTLELTRLAVEEHDPTVVWSRIGPFWTQARRFEGFDTIVAEVYRDHSGEVERFD